MQRVRHVPAEVGIWVVIFVDLLVFGSLFINYAIVRAGSASLWSAGLSEFDRLLGLVNTIVLLTSSLLVAMAIAAIRNAQRAQARALTLGAIALALVFAGIKVFEYCEKLGAGLNTATSPYFNFYYSLTGLHLFHVVVGLGVLVWMRRGMASSVNARQIGYIECGAIFWHMVDLLWIVIFPLIYLL